MNHNDVMILTSSIAGNCQTFGGLFNREISHELILSSKPTRPRADWMPLCVSVVPSCVRDIYVFLWVVAPVLASSPTIQETHCLNVYWNQKRTDCKHFLQLRSHRYTPLHNQNSLYHCISLLFNPPTKKTLGSKISSLLIAYSNS